MPQTIGIERKKLLEVAREYRKQGYRVVVEPQGEQLPEFLAAFRPDLIAQSDHETVVVEIKSRHSLSMSPEMEALAAAIQQREGWRFELIVTNPKEQEVIRENQDDLLAKQDILTRLNEARLLLHQEHGEAALLLAWSATEATLRRLLIQEHLSAENSSVSILKNLFAYGIIDREQYSTLRQGLELRNTIMHGYKEGETSIDITSKLLSTMEQLLY